MRAVRAFAAAALLSACAAMPEAWGPPRPSPAWQAVAEGERLRRSGRLEEAASLYRRALEVDPGDVRAHLGLLNVRLARGEDLALRREYRAGGDPFALGRLEADEGRRIDAFRRAPPPWSLLGLASVEESRGDRAGAARLYGRALQGDPGNLFARLGLARVRLNSGSPGLAAALFEDAAWTDPENPAPAAALGLLADRRGDLGEADRHAREALRRASGDVAAARRVFDLALRSSEKAAWRRAAEALLAAEGTEGVAPLLAARLLFLSGDATEARRALARARAEGATAEEAELCEPGPAPREGFARFCDALRRGVEARYRHFAATGEAERFEEFRAFATALFERETGRSLGSPATPLRYAFVGTLVDPTAASTDALVRACAQEGFLLVIGQRRGGPPEAMLARILSREPASRARVRGMEVEREVVRIAEPCVPGYLEWSGTGDLAGLALERIVILDAWSLARWEGDLARRRARLLDRREAILAEPALEDKPHDALVDPAGVQDRLLLSGPIDLEGEVRVHEDAHLVDAALHLPVGAHPLRNFGLALRRGFRALEIQAYLERNAQLAAIAEGPSPHAALASCVAALGGEGPHARGYAEIVAALVREVQANPARYPGVDPHRVILQQLHRIGEAELRAAARVVARRFGIAFAR
jgi:tetratricopeptide (TPR) repeat protein